MAATIFEIIGVIAILLGVLIVIAVFFFMNKGLKSLNKVLGARKGDISKDLRLSMDGLNDAQGQIDALAAMTDGVKAGMQSAIRAADTLVALVKSNAFQVGVPAVMWVLLVFIAIPRALFPLKKNKKKKKKITPIPPPSWEALAD